MFLELKICTEYGTLLLMKEVIWHPNAIEEIRKFPNQVKKDLGYLIYKLQIGEIITAPYSKPFKSIEVDKARNNLKELLNES